MDSIGLGTVLRSDEVGDALRDGAAVSGPRDARWLVTSATPAHIEAIAENFVEFTSATNQERHLSLQEAHAFVRGVLEDPAGRAWYVALDPAREVVGQAMVITLPDDLRPGEVWLITNMFVRPTHRKSGIHAAIGHHIEREAGHRSEVREFWAHVPKGRKHRRYYEKRGWRSDYVLLTRPVRPRGSEWTKGVTG